MPAVALWNPHSQQGLWAVGTAAQLLHDPFQPLLSSPGLDLVERDAINTRRAAVRTAASIGFVVGFGSSPFPRRQTSLVAHCPCSVRAATITPVGPPVAYLARFPGGIGLPVVLAGRLLRWHFRGLLGVRHARSADLQKEAFSQSASDHSSPPGPPRVLPAGARVCRPGLPPGRTVHLVKAHRTVEPKTHIRWCDDESVKCSGSEQVPRRPGPE